MGSLLKITVLFGITCCTPPQNSPKARSTSPLGQKLVDLSEIKDPEEIKAINEQIEALEKTPNEMTTEDVSALQETQKKQEDVPQLPHGDSYNVSQNLQGGFIDGNSGSYITYENNPWFLANENDAQAKFTYCISANEADYGELYSIPLKNAQDLIALALNQWDVVLSEMKKAINYKSDNQQSLNDQLDSLKIIDRSPKKIVSASQEVGCDNNPAPDLVFLFAEDTHKDVSYIKGIKAKIGASIRTFYDPKNFKSKGLIWIVPDIKNNLTDMAKNRWQEMWRFHAVVLHEIGHIYGLPHDSVEIMQETFPLAVVSALKGSFNHLKFKDENNPYQDLVSPKSILGQSWLYSNTVEQYLYAIDKNKINSDEILAMENFSRKKIINGFPEEVDISLENNALVNSILKFSHVPENRPVGAHNIQLASTVLNFGSAVYRNFSYVFKSMMRVTSVTLNPVFTKLTYRSLTTNNTWVDHPMWLLGIPPKNDYLAGTVIAVTNSNSALISRYSVLIEKKNYGKDLMLNINNLDGMYLTFFTKISSPKSEIAQ